MPVIQYSNRFEMSVHGAKEEAQRELDEALASWDESKDFFGKEMVSWTAAFNGDQHSDKAKREAAARRARDSLQAAENRFLQESTKVYLKMDAMEQQLVRGKPTGAASEEEAAYWTRFLEWTSAGVKYLN